MKKNLNIIVTGLITAVLLSCAGNTDKNGTGEQLPSPEVTVIRINGDTLSLEWTAVPGADGYAVKYDTVPEYKTTKETTERYTTINGLDMNLTYYVAVVAKKGEEFSAMPDDPIVIEEGVVIGTGSGVVIGGGTGNGGNEPNVPEPLPEPFSYLVHAEQKAAWDAQGLSSYSFSVYSDGIGSYLFLVSGTETTVTYLPFVGNPIIVEDDYYNEFLYPVKMRNIDDLFASLLELADNNYRIYVKYDETYHYPKESLLGAVEGRILGIITDFEPLN